MSEAAKFLMRSPCAKCGETEGRVIERNGQDTVRCRECDAFQYNAPRVETGRAVRSATTVHDAVRPKQRARILMRAGAKCEVCGARGELHVGHIVSVSAGLACGVPDEDLNHDENLLALCPACNLGMGAEPMPLRVAIAVMRTRISWLRKQGA